jgi:shikimate kinase
MAQAHSASFRRVFLIGFMGAGKTSVGRALASRLGWDFCDLDQLIESREGGTVAGIFAARGEDGFRKAEAAALDHVLQDSGTGRDLVVALGGGAFAQARNREALEQADGVTVLLEAPLEELRRRCSADATIRPLALDATRFAELFNVRKAAYQLARHKINTMNKAVEEVAAEIERILAETMPEVKQ